MKASLLLTCCNSGKKFVEDTIESISQSAGKLDYEIIVVDDCSTDGACDSLSGVRLIKNESRLGCSGSRKKAATLATGDVFITSDPHCDFPSGVVERLASVAIRCGDIVQPPIRYSKTRDFGGFKVRVTHSGLDIVRRRSLPQYQLMYGSIYAMSRRTYTDLGELPPLPGWWTWFELFHTTLAYRLGRSVKQLDGPKCTHKLYRHRGRLPFTLPADHKGRNAHWYYSLLLPESYERVFKRMLLKTYVGVDFEQDFITDRYGRLKEWLSSRFVRSEQWFLENVCKIPDLESHRKVREYLA